MNIFLKELKSYRKSLIFWSIGVFLMVASGMAKYEAYSSSGQSINDLIADMPKSMKAVMGFGVVDLSKISGYYSIAVYLFIINGDDPCSNARSINYCQRRTGQNSGVSICQTSFQKYHYYAQNYWLPLRISSSSILSPGVR